MEKIQKLFTLAEVKEVNEEERSLVGTASTEVLDRDKEIIKTDGWELDNFRKNPVILLSHEYRQPPIGKALWVKKDKNGLKFKAQFAKTQVAEEVFQLYKDGFMRAFSVGFIPKEWEEGDPEDEKGPRRIYTKQELLEISAVSVPSNPDALVTAVNEGRIKTKVLKEALHIEDNKKEVDNMQEKGVIPFKETPKAPEDEPWDAAREVREATVDDLKVMCTWYDSERPDVKQSYKLPHHKASGQHPVVWRGVAAAMAALFGARGGVNIPEKDRKGVYNHLAKHYKQFDKEPPEFREYSEEELKEMFPEVYEERLRQESIDIEGTLKELKDEIKSLKEGRVLSEKNRKLIQNAISQMKEAIAALEELLGATEPPKEESVIDIEERKEEKKTVEVDEKKLKEIIATNLRELVKEITSQQIDKLRGKVL